MSRRLHRVEISNWKAARHVVFSVKPGVTQICGPNESGKSSSLHAIIGTLAGVRKIRDPQSLKSFEDQILTVGELRGGCKLDLGDIDVERVLTEKNQDKGGELHATFKDGKKVPKPQDVLSALFGASIDPLALARMPAKELILVLQEIAGQEWLDEKKRIDQEYEAAKAQRALSKKRLAEFGTQPDPGPEPQTVSTDQAMEELKKAQAFNEEQGRRNTEIEKNKHAVHLLEVRIGELKQALQQAEIELKTLTEASLPSPQPLIDVAPLQRTISEAGAQNKAREVWQAARARVERWKEASKEVNELENKVSELSDTKEKHARAMKLPVEGFTWTDERLFFEGRPWEQESTSKRLKLCLKLGIALHPDLQLILIHQGEGLDQKSFLEFCDEVHEAGFDCLMEVVGDPKQGGDAVVVIREGYGYGEEDKPAEPSMECPF